MKKRDLVFHVTRCVCVYIYSILRGGGSRRYLLENVQCNVAVRFDLSFSGVSHLVYTTVTAP